MMGRFGEIVIIFLLTDSFGMCHLSFNAILDGSDEVLAVTSTDGVQNTFLVSFVFFSVGEDFFHKLIKVGIGPERSFRYQFFATSWTFLVSRP